MTPEEREQQIKFHRSEVIRLRAECPHSFKPFTKKELKDENYSSWAYCIGGCSGIFGWRCKESPDSVCHYDLFDDKHVKLLNGELALISEEFLEDAKDNNYEICLFCGDPNERK